MGYGEDIPENSPTDGSQLEEHQTEEVAEPAGSPTAQGDQEVSILQQIIATEDVMANVATSSAADLNQLIEEMQTFLSMQGGKLSKIVDEKRRQNIVKAEAKAKATQTGQEGCKQENNAGQTVWCNSGSHHFAQRSLCESACFQEQHHRGHQTCSGPSH